MIGERIRTLRERQGMSQAALARALGASVNAINYIEGGSTRAPHIDRLIAIADLFDVSLDYLVGRTDDPSLRPRVARAQKQNATAPPPTKRQRSRKAAPVA
jgi:transcriptional regulator with XRE-family HTH domain